MGLLGYPITPDGRYFVVRGRLWRKSNPALPADQVQLLVADLMQARRALKGSAPPDVRARAQEAVNAAKTALGERRAVWWTDGAPDYNRKLVRNTPYAEWLTNEHTAHVDAEDRCAGDCKHRLSSV